MRRETRRKIASFPGHSQGEVIFDPSNERDARGASGLTRRAR